MRISTLICGILLALTAQAQTKEAQFKKIENLLKLSNGLSIEGLKITNQLFAEKTVKLEGVAEGKNGTILYANLNWDGFDFYVEEPEGSEKLAKLTIGFDKDIAITTYENNQQIDKDETDELVLFVSPTDAKMLEQYLEELQTYTWKALAEIRTAGRGELVSFLTKTLNAAVADDEGKVKSITDCEITFAFEEEEIAIPTKKLRVHMHKDDGDYYQFCYGKQTAAIKTRKSATWVSSNVEHPDIDLDLGDEEVNSIQLQYAIKRLAAFCK